MSTSIVCIGLDYDAIIEHVSDSASTFRKPADAYDRLMGRYSRPLAEAFTDAAGVEPGWRALDVGCGPGALTEVLAARLGGERVAAVDPSEPFAAACAERVPGADVRVASADRLPHDDDAFDATLSQLVVNFLPDAPAALAEMTRVTRPGGVVTACTWDYAGGMTMLRTFWDAALAADPAHAGSADEGQHMRYRDPDELRSLWSDGGLNDVDVRAITVSATYGDFDDFWSPFLAGVGPAGAYCARLDDRTRDALREECRTRLGSPDGPFELSAKAWAARGTV